MYKETRELRLLIYRQYSQESGDLTSAGEYQINERVKFDDGQAKGTVAWKYQDQQQGLIYVLEDYAGFPFKIMANEIISKI
jgi:DUF971 family protein